MTKTSRDRRIENRRLSHVTCDENIFEDLLGKSSVCFSARDIDPETGIECSFPLEEVEIFETGSEQEAVAEHELVEQRRKNGVWDENIGQLKRTVYHYDSPVSRKIIEENIANQLFKD